RFPQRVCRTTVEENIPLGRTRQGFAPCLCVDMSGIRYGLKKTPVRASTAENVVRADGSAESLMGVPCEYGTYDCRLTAARCNSLSLSGSTPRSSAGSK
ncbi:MAG TPA: hypothetical protein VNO24_16915, partial [Blastocatellia bacterium]|nr:hypothetical protein [Blastocatellia bacterium]